MCRIFGHFDSQATVHELRTVAALQRHGGPDAQYITTGDTWGLGNNRLAIMDLDGGDQPYVLDGIVVVFNGEIYNHNELRRMLTARGHRFPDLCDGSILPALYAEFGTAFTEHLDGMYAVAVVDLRGEPKLVLATDDMGMKPLYYHWNAAERHLYFASELPALLSFRAVRARVWEPGLDAYLATKTPFSEQTMFDGIRVLPPAATAEVTRGSGLRVRVRDTSVPPADAGPEEAAERVRELLRHEVHRLTRADVPVCAITSGGLDSSLVTALAAERVGELHSFNIAYRGTWPADERGFAQEVASRHGTRHHQVEIDPADFPDLLSDVVWHLGQPNADPITLSTYALFRAVHQAGFKVAVTGDAADELFGGYDRIKAALKAGAGDDWVPAYVRALAAVPRERRLGLYSDDYRHFITAHGTAEDHLERALTSSPHDRLTAITEVEIGRRLPAYHLRRVDHLSMASSVEVRLPFCQPALVRYARSLPAALKVEGDQVKKVLYAAAGGLLPDSVLNRPKQPFTLPITAMLSDGRRLMEFARDMLAPARLRRHGRLDPDAVQALLRTQSTTPNDASALAVWSLLIHELWLDQFHAATPRNRHEVLA
ncbi:MULTISPECIES: asparagine synthase (glutamine-hydrolyzing) [Streptomyces]|uniref:asparagine synthase (glutamine-hydrolyzing) n=1 Tax=Streptomyces TaxID=1883 RepID=UPI00167764F5|nr:MULTISPECIES: asparagine synthase (glutamine-hydrolyzing) [Streptomyces]MBK3522041.1 asparagine synthase (glutamine-hydrolyzing) [Streptomyces sp. MBT70]GGR95830.1 asparagine synthetase [glutamine-hydrolyzing] 3 [Streptomyces eurythermus]